MRQGSKKTQTQSSAYQNKTGGKTTEWGNGINFTQINIGTRKTKITNTTMRLKEQNRNANRN